MSPAVKRFVGAGLMGVGAMMAALCGGCGALFGGGAILGLVTGDDVAVVLQILIAAAILGGLPALVGVWLFTLGRRLTVTP